MTEPTRTPVAGDERVAELQQQVASLRNDLAALRASLATEVRTRRLVVEEEDGFERIVAEGRGTHGKVEVHARPVDEARAFEGAILGEDASVTLAGIDEEVAPTARVYFTAGGNVCGLLGTHGSDETEGPTCSLEFDVPTDLPNEERLEALERLGRRTEAAMTGIGAVASTVRD